MSKRDLLLEIGLEEMPAKVVTSTMNQLSEKMKRWLENNKIEFGEIVNYSTPRRLALLIKEVEESQKDIHEEAKGPARKIALDENGNWTKAAIGFTRGQGMNVEDIYFKEVGGIEYVHVEKFIKGAKTIALLPELKDIITGLTFPKNMRWANEDLKFVRPIKWLIALFGSEVIPFSITNVTTSNGTMGHRFLGGRIEILDPTQYVDALERQFVIVDASKRKESILSQIKMLEEEQNWIIPVDKDLLEEVNNLVEYPTVLKGSFEEEFLDLPEEVLVTSMKEHQRYFPVKSKDGKLLPFFVTVRNGNREHIETVAKGNEKVLRARLADAAFFYREDQKVSIDQFLTKLETIVYHEEIGTIAEKSNRVHRLTNELTALLDFNEEDKKVADRAAKICKFDLVTNMVYEFPELQGFMGEKYALQKGEEVGVSIAIKEHYMPRNAEDSTPETNAGAVLAIAEKLDTICSTIAIGIIPSGSQDPYALRRQATGIVQTLINKDWDIDLEKLIQTSVELVMEANFSKLQREELESELLSFFKLRLKFLLQERGIRHDLIDALLDTNVGVVSSFVRKADILSSKKEEAGFKESIEALSRVISISKKAEGPEKINPTLFENDDEQNLYNKYLEVTEVLSQNVTEEEYFNLLTSLQKEINAYFDHTMVMVEDENLRKNRLSFMWKLARVITRFANVNEILVK